MKTWWDEHWTAFAARMIVSVALFLSLSIFAITYLTPYEESYAAPVEAAGGPGVVMCVKTATTGDIDVWLCEPLIGPEFIINSVGFMQVID